MTPPLPEYRVWRVGDSRPGTIVHTAAGIRSAAEIYAEWSWRANKWGDEETFVVEWDGRRWMVVVETTPERDTFHARSYEEVKS